MTMTMTKQEQRKRLIAEGIELGDQIKKAKNQAEAAEKRLAHINLCIGQLSEELSQEHEREADVTINKIGKAADKAFLKHGMPMKVTVEIEGHQQPYVIISNEDHL